MYQKTSNSVHYIKYHIILTVKYRKHLMNSYGEFIVNVINELTKSHKFTIDNIGYDIDHIHMLISARPDISPSQIVKTIKQKTSYELWDNFEQTLRKHFWKKHIFWSRSSFISTVGEVNQEEIDCYIANQGRKPRLSVGLKTQQACAAKS
jgi:putative transposase